MSTAPDLNPEDFVLVLSVGGSPEPIIQSIRNYKSYYVIFIASKDSSAIIMDVLRETERIRKHETITLSDFQDLVACVRDIREELPKKLQAMNLPPDILLVGDITGGTKVMSAALTLALMEFNSRFSYVGGTKRTKAGLGTTENGYEKILQMANPWDALGLREARSLAQAFNTGQFAAARENAEFMKSRDSEYRTFYDGLSLVIEAFRTWDTFNYKSAKNTFLQGIRKLQSYNNRRHKNFCALYEELEKSLQQLEKVAGEAAILQRSFHRLESGAGFAYIRDLIANARRCADRGHFDDAVARLYSAIEKTAKIALAQRGINNSDMPKEAIIKAGAEIAAKYGCVETQAGGVEKVPDMKGNAKGDKIKVPLEDSFLILCSIEPEDQIAAAYKEHADILKKTLESRNMSLLAHGYNPVNEEDYQKLYKTALSFLNIAETDLHEFPVIEMNQILF